MKRLQSSSALNQSSVFLADDESRRQPLFSSAASNNEGAIWGMAVVGLLFAVAAANLLCLSPRWYSNRFISLVYEPSKFVLLSAATGGAAVRILWGLLSRKPSAGPTSNDGDSEPESAQNDDK